MAENTDNKSQPNNFKPKTSGTAKPKFNMTFFYLALIIILLGIQFFSGRDHAVETTWHEVKSTMLKDNDIEKVVIVNKTTANIYLKEASYEKYKEKIGKGFTKPGISGPQFYFTVGSVDKFEETEKFLDSRIDSIIKDMKLV